MMDNTAYDTMTQAIDGLRSEGYTEDFNLIEDCLACHGKEYRHFQDDFMIDATYRFEGTTDPGDEAIVYAISSDKFGLKGVLVDAYGPDSTPAVDAMVKKMRFRN